MAVYVEYLLEDHSTIWIETEESAKGAIKAADVNGDIIIKAEKLLRDALSSVKQSALALHQGFSDLQADEVEVTFGIKTIGEAGFFVIGKAGGEMNYGVTLRWKKKE